MSLLNFTPTARKLQDASDLHYEGSYYTYTQAEKLAGDPYCCSYYTRICIFMSRQYNHCRQHGHQDWDWRASIHNVYEHDSPHQHWSRRCSMCDLYQSFVGRECELPTHLYEYDAGCE